MWKAQLECDTCHDAYVDAIDIGSRSACAKARNKAREAGWVYTKTPDNRGTWTCIRCSIPGAFFVGQQLTYHGKVSTAESITLLGRVARVVSVDPTMNKVWVQFEDPATGQYARHAHWFYPREFVPVQADAQTSSD